MAYRRHLATLFRHSQTLLSSNSHSLHPFKSTLLHLHSRILHPEFLHHRNFSSQSNNPRKPRIISEDEPEEDDEEEEETSDEEGEMEEIEERESRIDSIEPSDPGSRSYWVEEKIKEAEEIGYKVMGPIQPSDRVFKSYEPLFAIVQIGSHQFKVSNGDCIYTERLKYCEVNDKLILNKVLLLGSQTQTIVGRPTLPDAAVQAVVEEHALDAKVIIFKKKRRKNYRRTKGHRQELTRLRITEIQGIDMPVNATSLKTEKSTSKRTEKVAVPA